MEITSKFKERENPSPLNSPSSNGATSCCTSSTNNGGNGTNPITRSDPNSPYPTTFVTADTSSFKQVVQMLTGSSDSLSSPKSEQPQPPSSKNFVIPPIKTLPKKQSSSSGFKLYERRNSGLKKMMINPLLTHQNASFSPRNKQQPEMLSPSLLDFPSLTLLSPVTPLLAEEDPFDKSSPSISSSSLEEEERAIAEKGFYLHPSPISTPRDSHPPQLLPLFPLSSPRVSSQSHP